MAGSPAKIMHVKSALAQTPEFQVRTAATSGLCFLQELNLEGENQLA